MKKRIVTILSLLLAAFLLVNLIWFGWRQVAYAGFAEG